MPWLITFDLWTWETLPKSNYIICISYSVPGSGMHKIRPKCFFVCFLLYWYHLKVIWGVQNYKRTDGCVFGWTNGSTDDLEITFSMYRFPRSLFSFQTKRQPFWKWPPSWKQQHGALGLNRKWLSIVCSIIWPSKIQLYQLLNYFITNLPC